jgi:transcriptional regulator with XRE-family HTH domain
MRMRLIARDALKGRMERKEYSNRRLARAAQVSPGTIDNLVSGRTQSVNHDETAKLICRALEVPVDVYFVPDISSSNSDDIHQQNMA